MAFNPALVPLGTAAINAVSRLFTPRGQKVAPPVAPKTEGSSFEQMLTAARSEAARTMKIQDADGDQRLDRLELGVTEQIFGRMDANGDGFVNQEELVQAYMNRTR